MKKIYLIITACSLFFQACYTTNYSYSIRASSVSLSEDVAPRPEDAKVLLVLTSSPPEYEEIGIVQVLVIDPMYDDIGKVMDKAKVEARKVGANIIVLKNKQVLMDPEKDSSTSTDGSGNELTTEAIKMQKYIKYVFSAGLITE